MAVYASRDGMKLIVGAADSLADLESFYAAAANKKDAYADTYQPSVLDMMSDERFMRFKTPPYVFECTSRDQLDTLVKDFDLTLMGPNKLADRHCEMIEALTEDPYFAASAEDDAERRTIAEIHGLDKSDDWDKRTEDQIKQDEEYKKKYDEAKKAGKLSGDDSFAPPDAAKARVTDVETTLHQDGTHTIDRVLAHKGLYADNDKDRIEAEKRVREGGSTGGGPLKQEKSKRSIDDIIAGVMNPGAAKPEPEPEPLVNAPVNLGALLAAASMPTEPMQDENGVDMTIAMDDAVALFFKVDVLNATVAQVEAKLGTDPIWKAVFEKRDTGANCWFAFVRHKQGVTFMDRAREEGFTIEENPYGVKPDGDRLVPKGIDVDVVDAEEAREIGPRPWNDRAHEIDAMTDEQKEENWKTVKGDEFIYCGSYEGAHIGCILYVAPKEWFAKHGTFFEHPLNIEHLFDRDVKEFQPGVYKTTSRDWNSLTFSLSKKGFAENMYLNLHLNSL